MKTAFLRYRRLRFPLSRWPRLPPVAEAEGLLPPQSPLTSPVPVPPAPTPTPATTPACRRRRRRRRRRPDLQDAARRRQPGACANANANADAGAVPVQFGTVNFGMVAEPACGFDAVNVTVTKVRFHMSATAAASDPGWTEIALQPARRINLAKMGNGALEALATAGTDAGPLWPGAAGTRCEQRQQHGQQRGGGRDDAKSR